jgi:hypothetical protein
MEKAGFAPQDYQQIDLRSIYSKFAKQFQIVIQFILFLQLLQYLDLRLNPRFFASFNSSS